MTGQLAGKELNESDTEEELDELNQIDAQGMMSLGRDDKFRPNLFHGWKSSQGTKLTLHLFSFWT